MPYFTSLTSYSAQCFIGVDKRDRYYDAEQRREEANGFHEMMENKRRNFLNRDN